MINYNLKLDASGEKILASDITFVTGDVGAYRLNFEFLCGEETMDISKYTLIVRAKRADGSCVFGTGEIVDNRGVFVPENTMYKIPGELIMEIALLDSAKNHMTTKIVQAEVLEGIGDECEPTENEIAVYVTLLSQVQSKIEATQKLIKDSIPQKGVDYFTEADKEEMIQKVLDELPDGEGVSY